MPIELDFLHSKSWSGNWGPEMDEDSFSYTLKENS